MNKKIYFAGSIRGGRVDAALYQRIIQYINRTDVVLTEHIFPTKPKNASINGWTGFWVESNIKTKKVRRDRCLVLAHFFSLLILSIEWFS